MDAASFCEEEHPRLVGALALWCGRVDIAEEMAQTAWERAVARWPEVAVMDRAGAWVHHVAMNLVTSRFRRVAAEARAYRRQRRRQRAFTATAGLLLIALISTGALLWTIGEDDRASVIAIGDRLEAPSPALEAESLERVNLRPVAMWRATTPQEGPGKRSPGP